MELKIYFEEIKPEYLAYIDICKEKALNDEVYHSTLLKEMSEGFINYFVEKKENDDEETKIRDLLDYQIKLMESMNFNNDVIVKRLNKIFNILVKQKQKDNILNDQPSVYLPPVAPINNDNNTTSNDSRVTNFDNSATSNETKQSRFHYRKLRHLDEHIEEDTEEEEQESEEEQSEEEIILNLQRSNNNEQSDN